jgi:hypothetical protein
VARLQSGAATPALVTSLVEADEDLSFRVERLLRATPVHQPNLRLETITLSCAALLIASIAFNPAGLHAVHQLLEKLLD